MAPSRVPPWTGARVRALHAEDPVAVRVRSDVGLLTVELLTQGVRYERPVALADRSLELRVRAPGRGRAFVTLEFGF